MTEKLTSLIDAAKHMKRELTEDYIPRTGMVSFAEHEFVSALAEYEAEQIEYERQQGLDETAKEMSLQSWVAHRCTYGSGIDPEKLAALFETIQSAKDDIRLGTGTIFGLRKIINAADVCRIKPKKEEDDTVIVCDGCAEEVEWLKIGDIHEVLHDPSDRFPELCGYAIEVNRKEWEQRGIKPEKESEE